MSKPLLPRPSGGSEVRFESVSKHYGGVAALSDVELHIAPGTIQAVIGRSGAGKSTLFRCTATLERPDKGRIVVDGLDLAHLQGDALRAARRHVGTVFQQLNLLPSRTAAGNVALPLELAGAPRETIDARVRELLGWVGLHDRAESHPRALSGGQRQRVAIARALATSPRLLLCDEPTSALDPETTDVVLELLRRVRDELGLTVLLISHDLAAVRRLADRVAVLESGRIVREGTANEIIPAGDSPRLPGATSAGEEQ